VRACPSVADIAALDQSTHVAQHPPRQSAIKWRSALRLLDWCGVRRNDLFLNLRLSNWIPGERCPVDTVELYWPWGWLSFVPEKTKRTKKRPHVVPLSPELASLFRQIIRPAGESDPPLLGFLDSTHQWYRELYRIQEQAGLAKRYGFHAFRKRCNVTWDETCGMGTGGLFLCHAAKGVNARSYSEAASLMVQAAEKRIAQPSTINHQPSENPPGRPS
jgi:integrase